MFDYRAVPFAKGFEDASLARGPLVAFVAWAAKAELGDGAGSPSSEMGGEMSVRSRHPALPLRRFVLILGVGAVAIILAAILHRVFRTADPFRLPSEATLAGLGMRQRIVAIADSQIGYSTEPSNTYCNSFSAYWDAGPADCPSGERDEEWCADFAACRCAQDVRELVPD
jgi:hypothetical protein